MELRARTLRATDDLYAAWNAHDPDGIAALFTEDAHFIDIVSGCTTLGRAAIRAFGVERLNGFPDLSIQRVTVVVDANAVAHTWVMRGTQTGTFEGLAPSGLRIEVAGATFSELDEQGLSVRTANYVDVPAFFRQLGLA